MLGRTEHDAAGFILLNLFGTNDTSNGVAEDPEEFEEFFRLVVRSLAEAENDTFEKIVLQVTKIQLLFTTYLLHLTPMHITLRLSFVVPWNG